VVRDRLLEGGRQQGGAPGDGGGVDAGQLAAG